jgi:hypothetical protein
MVLLDEVVVPAAAAVPGEPPQLTLCTQRYRVTWSTATPRSASMSSRSR